jgi:ATP-dependent exoDNAse (exonuclease V) beta subunit
LEDGTLVESVADLAFQEDNDWTVVDFKTDYELGERVETYRRQVAVYVRGIERATGAQVRGVLLRI